MIEHYITIYTNLIIWHNLCLPGPLSMVVCQEMCGWRTLSHRSEVTFHFCLLPFHFWLNGFPSTSILLDGFPNTPNIGLFGQVETFSDPGRSVMWEQIPGLWRLKQGRRQLFWQLLLLLWKRQLPPGGSWAQGGEKGGGGAGGWGGGGGSQRWRMKWREFMEAEEGGGGLILRWKVKMGRGGEGGEPSLRTSSTSSPTCSWRRWEVITLCEFLCCWQCTMVAQVKSWHEIENAGKYFLFQMEEMAAESRGGKVKRRRFF